MTSSSEYTIVGKVGNEDFVEIAKDVRKEFYVEVYIHHWNNTRRQVKLKGLTPVESREQALREAA